MIRIGEITSERAQPSVFPRVKNAANHRAGTDEYRGSGPV